MGGKTFGGCCLTLVGSEVSALHGGTALVSSTGCGVVVYTCATRVELLLSSSGSSRLVGDIVLLVPHLS